MSNYFKENNARNLNKMELSAEEIDALAALNVEKEHMGEIREHVYNRIYGGSGVFVHLSDANSLPFHVHHLSDRYICVSETGMCEPVQENTTEVVGSVSTENPPHDSITLSTYTDSSSGTPTRPGINQDSFRWRLFKFLSEFNVLRSLAVSDKGTEETDCVPRCTLASK